MQPASLVTSYHYLRYILFGFFMYVTNRFLQSCCLERPDIIQLSETTHYLVVFLYLFVGFVVFTADVRNYVLYKLLYHRHYELQLRGRSGPRSNLDTLRSMLIYRDEFCKYEAEFEKLRNIETDIKNKPSLIIKCFKKWRFNWLMFLVVQPGPVSALILTSYFLVAVGLSVASFLA